MKESKDWSRHERAVQMRKSGMTWRAIAADLGVSLRRAQVIVSTHERRKLFDARRAAAESEEPK